MSADVPWLAPVFLDDGAWRSVSEGVHGTARFVSVQRGDEVDVAQQRSDLRAVGFACSDEWACTRGDVQVSLGAHVFVREAVSDPARAVHDTLALADDDGFAALRALHDALGGDALVRSTSREETRFSGEPRARSLAVHYELDADVARAAVDEWLASHGQRLDGFDVQFPLGGASVGVELRGGDVRLFALRFLEGGAPRMPDATPHGPTLGELEADPSFSDPPSGGMFRGDSNAPPVAD